MDSTSAGLSELIDLWSRCHRLSPSQRVLLETASACEPDSLALHLRVTQGELEVLEELFAQRTGRSVEAAVLEIRRIAEGRGPKGRTPIPEYDRLAETLPENFEG